MFGREAIFENVERARNATREREAVNAQLKLQQELEQRLREQNEDELRRANEVTDRLLTTRERQGREQAELARLRFQGLLSDEFYQRGLDDIELRAAAAARPDRAHGRTNLLESHYLTGRGGDRGDDRAQQTRIETLIGAFAAISICARVRRS